ncbi:MAG: DNA recombination protein RmuC [Rhodospirillaceae bacterium]|jgi:DNA recombination protein RmuC|nr:DNA recombination protein RmuC [Rhodospirillaceae bacterium]
MPQLFKTLESRLNDIPNRKEQNDQAKSLREEVMNTLKSLFDLQKGSLEELRTTVDKLKKDNFNILEQMRKTVDEKLQETLENRLKKSFSLVVEQLELVHKDIGKMQNLAEDVGDFKKIFNNVKTRGIWGEVQLSNLLEQMLTTDQYVANGDCKKGSQERVDFAVCLPSKNDDIGEVLLPIDAKFPQDDYERLCEATERADADGVEFALKELESRIKKFAKDICNKYINPPYTTDFAIMFLPTEGLYSEVLRRPGLAVQLQRDYRVIICGPTTTYAILNSLLMGFKTLAISKQSSVVWKVLEEVRNEFGKYGEILDKVQKKLSEASDSITNISIRKRKIDSKLSSVAKSSSDLSNDLPKLDFHEEILRKSIVNEREFTNDESDNIF